MNINRNNYEEYFLLYADNELSKAERKMVEVFVNENPEFKEEFCMLKLTINLPDEDMKLDDKLFLYKSESTFLIKENNYEEVFVLYHDNELSEKEKLETENFVAQHPNLKDEFELIGKAKLTPDLAAVYPDKNELYRKEKSGTVVSMMIWRYLAAAVLIGFGLWFSIPYFTTQQANVPVTAQVNPVKKSAPATKNTTTEESKKETTQLASSPVNEEKNDFSEPDKMDDKQVQKPTKSVAIAKGEVKNETPSLTRPIQQIKREPVDVVAVKAPIEKIEGNIDNYKLPLQDEAKTDIKKIKPQVESNYSKTVVYNPQASVNNDNYVFYDVPAEQFNKTKVGGFLKKVKRIVERTNPITKLLEGNEEPVVAKNF